MKFSYPNLFFPIFMVLCLFLFSGKAMEEDRYESFGEVFYTFLQDSIILDTEEENTLYHKAVETFIRLNMIEVYKDFDNIPWDYLRSLDSGFANRQYPLRMSYEPFPESFSSEQDRIELQQALVNEILSSYSDNWLPRSIGRSIEGIEEEIWRINPILDSLENRKEPVLIVTDYNPPGEKWTPDDGLKGLFSHGWDVVRLMNDQSKAYSSFTTSNPRITFSDARIDASIIAGWAKLGIRTAIRVPLTITESNQKISDSTLLEPAAQTSINAYPRKVFFVSIRYKDKVSGKRSSYVAAFL